MIDGQGNAVSTVAGFGEGLGALRTPTSLVLDRNNRLFIVSSGNSRIEVLGLDSFSDPKSLPAVVSLQPSTFNRGPGQAMATNRKDCDSDRVICLLKIVGVAPELVLPGSITANGLPARRYKGVELGDFDADGSRELRVWFDRKSLLATLPNGPGIVVVKGTLADGFSFEGSASVLVTGGGSSDSGGDASNLDSEGGSR